jgi:hypothetical protein
MNVSGADAMFRGEADMLGHRTGIEASASDK